MNQVNECEVMTATPWGIDAKPIAVRVMTCQGRDWGIRSDAIVERSKKIAVSVLRIGGYELSANNVRVEIRVDNGVEVAAECLDMAIATGILGAIGRIPVEALRGRMICGDLTACGNAPRMRGAYAIAELAREMGMHEVLLPESACRVASLVDDVRLIPVNSLWEACDHLSGENGLDPFVRSGDRPEQLLDIPDLSSIKGQWGAKRALEVAAAGWHGIMLVGPLESEKRAIAHCLPGILPPMTIKELIEVLKVRSLIGEYQPSLMPINRPFRAPHITTDDGMLGSTHLPGDLTRAHAGVLLLDQLPDFRRSVLSAMVRPLLDGKIGWGGILGSGGTNRAYYPARAMVVALMDNCPCGYCDDPRKECRCTAMQMERYWSRMPGPMGQCIDINADVPVMTEDQYQACERERCEPSSEVAKRVAAAMEIQQSRECINGSMPEWKADRICKMDASTRGIVDAAVKRFELSAHERLQLLRVSRTIADLDGSDEITQTHAAEAVMYTNASRKNAVRRLVYEMTR